MRSYEDRVRLHVRLALNTGEIDFLDVLTRCAGADPRLVRRFYDEEVERGATLPSTRAQAAVRSPPWRLPAPDPALAQWWFTSSTRDALANVVASSIDGDSEGARVLCLGAPTLGPRLAGAAKVTVADVDPDVLAAVTEDAAASFSTVEYDVASPLPEELRGAFDTVVADPPWYAEDLKRFVKRSLQALRPGGVLLVSLPPSLTRPTADDERAEMLDWLTKRAVKIEALESGALHYLVPRFEEVALRGLPGFSGRPWRTGDLLRARAETSYSEPDEPVTPARNVKGFARSSTEFRVFLASTAKAPARSIISPVEGYASNVSRRAHALEPDIWTTEKAGVRVENWDEARIVLESWAVGQNETEAASSLASARGVAAETARHVVEEYERALGLWSRYAQGTPRRSPEQIAEARSKLLSSWATRPSERVASDGFRIQFQRDRDRILWSSSLRRLANKTQLFPADRDDQLRQRLTHSIEVMQLALTIAASFGLDEDLVQAGSLAHDIGHTPFGHAGEYALDRLLKRINPSLPGFNHYEHGVDIVRWLEAPYQSPEAGGFPGLSLTPEVAECIFKHTYCQTGAGLSHDALRRLSKHRYLPDGYCHLEGQAVRLADKVSYLVSDLEDGVRLGAVTERVLLHCRLFHRPPIDLASAPSVGLLERLVQQRKNILKVLMEDAILETGRRLAKRQHPGDVRNATEYTVDHSPELKMDMEEIWHVVQGGRLHKHPAVVAANMRAARCTSELTLLFAIFPQFIETEFLQAHERLHDSAYMKHYTDLAGRNVQVPPPLLSFLPVDLMIGEHYEPGQAASVTTPNLIMATDFVAGLTDARARDLHARYIESRATVARLD